LAAETLADGIYGVSPLAGCRRESKKGAYGALSFPYAPPADERREAQAQAPIMRQATAGPSRAPRTLRELFGF